MLMQLWFMKKKGGGDWDKKVILLENYYVGH